MSRPKPNQTLCQVFVAEYLATIGAKGGKAGTGKAKARTKAQARKAAQTRWAKHRKPKDA